MDKNSRHRAIREIITARPISKQSELVDQLTRRGFDVSQATVSRDIKEIPLNKVRTGAGFVYSWPGREGDPAGRLARLMREAVLSVRVSENLVLLRTDPGLAAPVAIALDEAGPETALGTVAGDDTVLVVARDRRSAEPLADRLRELSFPRRRES